MGTLYTVLKREARRKKEICFHQTDWPVWRLSALPVLFSPLSKMLINVVHVFVLMLLNNEIFVSLLSSIHSRGGGSDISCGFSFC